MTTPGLVYYCQHDAGIICVSLDANLKTVNINLTENPYL
jgi:hypothetical protein